MGRAPAYGFGLRWIPNLREELDTPTSGIWVWCVTWRRRCKAALFPLTAQLCLPWRRKNTPKPGWSLQLPFLLSVTGSCKALRKSEASIITVNVYILIGMKSYPNMVLKMSSIKSSIFLHLPNTLLLSLGYFTAEGWTPRPPKGEGARTFSSSWFVPWVKGSSHMGSNGLTGKNSAFDESLLCSGSC